MCRHELEGREKEERDGNGERREEEKRPAIVAEIGATEN